MSKLTSAENAEFERSFYENLGEQQSPAAIAADPKTIFCDNWESAKGVLEAIGGLSGNVLVVAAIKVVVAAGDALKKVACAA